ncbi:MAG: hypothetical protein AAF203_07890 [Pseudomonadota bacterium]
MSGDLPPEAYTKETLQSAFDWLQTQPDVVRSAVHTPERLVSLYQKSQRLNDKDHPVSSKKFISDLKNLATSLDQFSGKPQAHTLPPLAATKETPTAKPKTVTFSESLPEAKRSQPGAPTAPRSFTPRENSTPTKPLTTEALALDPVTMKKISEVQARFNLSSANEAIRALVSLGYEKFSKFD